MHGTAVHPREYSSPNGARLTAVVALAAIMSALLVLGITTAPSRAYAVDVATVNLGTASPFSVLGGQTVTNTGPTTLEGDLGVFPGEAITGFPPGLVAGETHSGDAVADQAQQDVTTAYNDAAERPSNFDLTDQNLGGKTLIPGVYTFSSSAQLTGTVTLDGQNNPNSVFIFQIGSTLTTATNSGIELTNGAQACNVFFQVGSSATLGVGTDFVGTVLALTSITANTAATIDGRLLARNGSVTLDSNVITASACEVATPTPTPTATPSDTPTSTETATVTESASPSDTPTVTESASPSDTPTATESASATESESASESASATESESASESASATESESASESASATESESASESASASESTGPGLADTGSSALAPAIGIGGALILLLGGAVLVAAHLRSRPKRRH